MSRQVQKYSSFSSSSSSLAAKKRRGGEGSCPFLSATLPTSSITGFRKKKVSWFFFSLSNQVNSLQGGGGGGGKANFFVAFFLSVLPTNLAFIRHSFRLVLLLVAQAVVLWMPLAEALARSSMCAAAAAAAMAGAAADTTTLVAAAAVGVLGAEPPLAMVRAAAAAAGAATCGGCEEEEAPPEETEEDPALLPADPALNRLAGHPYLLLLRCLSMSHLRLNAFPQDGHRWVPRWMWRWCCREPGCLKILPHSSQLYRPMASGVQENALPTQSVERKAENKRRSSSLINKSRNLITVQIFSALDGPVVVPPAVGRGLGADVPADGGRGAGERPLRAHVEDSGRRLRAERLQGGAAPVALLSVLAAAAAAAAAGGRVAAAAVVL